MGVIFSCKYNCNNCDILILVPAVHFSKKPPEQLNDIYTGMSETDMLEILGKPKKIEQIDETTKMYLYSQVDKGGYFLWSYYKDFQILIKTGLLPISLITKICFRLYLYTANIKELTVQVSSFSYTASVRPRNNFVFYLFDTVEKSVCL